MQEKTLDAILAMLTGLGIPHGTDPDVLLRTYAVAVHGVREDCIVEMCGKYIRGEVEGHKKGRAPTTDLFTQECRSWASAITAQENRKNKRLPAPEPEPEFSEEHRAKMRFWFATLAKSLTGDPEARRLIAEKGWRS